MRIAGVMLAGLLCGCAATEAPVEKPAACATQPALTDLAAMRDRVKAEMAYPTGGGVSADAIYAQLEPLARMAQDKTATLRVLEQFVYDLGDHHAHLGRNDDDSSRLAPTGASVWAEARGGDVVVTEVRPGSAARAAGLREGMVIDAVDGVTPAALKPPLSAPERAQAMRGFAARVAMAGTHAHDASVVAHDAKGKVSVKVTGPADEPDDPASLSWPEPGVALIRINNTMGSDRLPPAFDALMREARKAEVILLDLRDTPSGGDSVIAKPVMSWFVNGPKGYQTHQRGAKTWTEQVKGRSNPFAGRLVVLVDHWTGSMGEGTAIGLRAAAGARLIGTPMAGLRGAIEGRNLPCSGISFRIPVERLFEVGGGPRELAQPDILVSEAELGGGTQRDTDDVILEKALDYARTAIKLAPPVKDSAGRRLKP